MTETAALYGKCPGCGNNIEIQQVWEPGGINDYGGYVVECAKCQEHFHLRLGRDIQMSRVVDGAKVLDAYDDEFPDHKEVILKRHGLDH